MVPKKRVVQVARDVAELGPDRPFSVLFVCTGNICRSPVAQLLFMQRLFGVEQVPLASAGTEALIGAPIDPRMRELLSADSHTDNFRGRQLTSRMVARAKLVLGMTREHRSAAVSLHPPALRYSFTLKEFAGILETQLDEAMDAETSTPLSAAERLADAVPIAFSQRVRFSSRRPESLDIDDPYGRSTAVFRSTFDDISSAADSIGRFLDRRSDIST